MIASDKALEEYNERRRQREEGYLMEEIRDSLRSLRDYVSRFTRGSPVYRERDRPETEFERRAVYDIMHGVGGQKDWPGW